MYFASMTSLILSFAFDVFDSWCEIWVKIHLKLCFYLYKKLFDSCCELSNSMDGQLWFEVTVCSVFSSFLVDGFIILQNPTHWWRNIGRWSNLRRRRVPKKSKPRETNDTNSTSRVYSQMMKVNKLVVPSSGVWKDYTRTKDSRDKYICRFL